MPERMTFGRFYWSLVCRIPALIFSATARVGTLSVMVVFIIVVLNRQWARFVMQNWMGFSPWWALIPVGALFIWALLKANFEKFQAVQDEVERLNHDIAQLQARLSPK